MTRRVSREKVSMWQDTRRSLSSGALLGFLMLASVTLAAAGDGSPCEVAADRVLLVNAVGPSWIAWSSPCLPGADLVYANRETWEIWVMDEAGGNQRCLTCKGENAIGVDFPLDSDGASPQIHWKGDPEAHPSLPVIFFKAENENSGHRQFQNSPSIGWDNDVWALDLCRKRYSRLTKLPRGHGIQHSALSEDGKCYSYPHRYRKGRALRSFGLARLIVGELAYDREGGVRLRTVIDAEPNGKTYYEPHDIRPEGQGHVLLYTAGETTRLDPYRFEWSCRGRDCTSSNTVLVTTPDLHEELTMFSPSGEKIAWMRGPQVGLGYHADMYVSNPDFTAVERVTWYNDCSRWPQRCREKGAQLSRLEWKEDGRAIFFGLWSHGGPLQLGQGVELRRIDFAGECGSK